MSIKGVIMLKKIGTYYRINVKERMVFWLGWPIMTFVTMQSYPEIEWWWIAILLYATLLVVSHLLADRWVIILDGHGQMIRAEKSRWFLL